MDLILKRKTFSEESTIGELYVNGVFACFTLEDKDRGLTKTMPIQDIMARKVYGQTAIPYGTYDIAITYSNRFEKYLPLLINVPGFEGIRIHPGNTAKDTHGCLLTGKLKGNNIIGNSVAAFKEIFAKLKAVEKKEKIRITITK